MNSYNENLHSTVVTTLSAQELEQTNMKASLDASMFTLYYAGGARMTAAEKLKSDQAAYNEQGRLKEQAVINNNLSVNLLTAANQEKQYVSKSVTDTAVAAANIQAASNAVLKLAGNMGSIFSMVGAADFDTDIYTQSLEAHRLMNQTAFDAERVSQQAMEASTLTAEVSSAMIADEAKATNEAIGGLYKVISTGFDATMAVVATDNATLASTSADEKKAEGDLEAINVEYYAARKAYNLNNKELNIDLRVPQELLTKDSYTVTFDYYQSPFPKPKSEVGPDGSGYPVSNYYIILVKDSQKSTFTLANAEAIASLKEDENRYKRISGEHTGRGVSEQLFISDIRDSDGDKMLLGASYVVFVLAELMTDYKKNINDFSDYLSAPSFTFELTNKLSSPEPSDNNIIVKNNVLTFHLREYQSYKVDYRCMFMPISKNLVKGLLSEQGLRTIESDVEKMERIAETYDPKIQELEVETASLQSDYDAKQSELREVRDKEKTAPPKEKAALEKEAKEIEAQMEAISNELYEKNAELQKTMKDKEQAIRSIDTSIDSEPGFFFNLTIAEQVAPANYKIAKMSDGTEGKDKDKDKDRNPKRYLNGTLTIDDTVTDNYGDPLMEGVAYIPVILSAASPIGQDVNQFTNSLSDYVNTKHFVYLTTAPVESVEEE